MTALVRPALVLAWKDVMLELRSRDVLISSLVFALLTVVVFNFALDIEARTVDALAPGVLWVAFAFAGVLAMSRAFVIEKDKGSLDGLLLCPVSRDSLYFGKMLSLFLFMAVIEALLLPAFIILFDYSAFTWEMGVAMGLATLGFAIVGTLFSAIAVNTRSREIMLPVLFFPVVAPLIIGAVEVSTGAVGDVVGAMGAGRWLQLMAVFDVVFLFVCPWVFGLVMEE